MASSLALALSEMFDHALQSVHDTFQALDDAGFALRLLIESPHVNSEQEFNTYSGTTSLQSLAKERDELKIAMSEIVARESSSSVPDEECSTRIARLMDFAIKFREAVGRFKHCHESPDELAQQEEKLFDGADNLRCMAETYETGRQTGLRERETPRPRQPHTPRGRG